MNLDVFFFFFLCFGEIQESLIADELGPDLDRSEPMAGTSRAMMDLDTQNTILDDGFGGSGFGRKLFCH